MSTIPYIDSYWVLQDQFLAGAYPGGGDEETTRRKVRSLINDGITCIIDLTQPGDSFFFYQEALDKEAEDFSVKVEHINFPIPDYAIPTSALMTQILDTIDQRLARGERVYVHCIGGIGRTGTTVACYLIRHGLNGVEALMELENLRGDVASWWRRSPESDDQIQFVLKWPTGK